MGLPQGWYFRTTNNQTSPANFDYATANGFSATYPIVSSNGIKYGQEEGGTDSRDRDLSSDVRLKGLVFASGADIRFRVDLPSTGTYKITAAFGDPSNAQTIKVEFFDDTTSLGVVCNGSTGAANHFFDAGGNLRTSDTDWASNNAAVTKTFSSTSNGAGGPIFRVKLYGTAGTACICTLYVESIPASGISHIQGTMSADGDSTAVASISGTLGASVTSGSLVCGAVAYGSDTTTVLTSITDDQANTYTIVDRQASTGDAESLATFYLANVTNAPRRITANFSPNTAFVRIVVDEFSGIATTTPADGHNIQWQSAAGTGTDAIQSPSITTASNGDLIYGATVDTNGNTLSATSLVAGTGFTADTLAAGTSSLSLGSEHFVQGSAGATKSTFTAARSLNWATGVMAFKAAGGGGGGGATTRYLTLLGVGD